MNSCHSKVLEKICDGRHGWIQAKPKLTTIYLYTFLYIYHFYVCIYISMVTDRFLSCSLSLSLYVYWLLRIVSFACSSIHMCDYILFLCLDIFTNPYTPMQIIVLWNVKSSSSGSIQILGGMTMLQRPEKISSSNGARYASREGLVQLLQRHGVLATEIEVRFSERIKGRSHF